MSDTLVLNGDFQPLCVFPLSVVDWQSAIKAVYAEKVSVVKNYDDWIVHSQKLSIPVPSIVVMREYVGSSQARDVNFNRKSIYVRDKFKCQYCGGTFGFMDLTLDHVVPKCYGGGTTWDNIVTACFTCNQRKGDSMHVRPHKMPEMPSFRQLESNYRRSAIFPVSEVHEDWREYLDFV
jgi:5-methylcytosine-specific restriction endonuclease McrA